MTVIGLDVAGFHPRVTVSRVTENVSPSTGSGGPGRELL